MDGFAERWQALGSTLPANIATDATITRQTLAASTAQSAAPSPPASNTLPRISVVPPETGAPRPPGNADFTLKRRLGAGGMGEVYLATQHSLQREVAIKILGQNADESVAASLIGEAIVAGFLSHPGVIPVHNLGIADDGRPVLVMERVEGCSYRELLDDANHQGWSIWDERTGDRLLANLDILSRVCDAVEFAHSRGILHRDIKPDNIMLGPFGEVYLLDWGIAARLNEVSSAELVGTPHYMAPEMVSGQPLSPATDVYLLGATLHQALTGQPRHPGETLRAVLESAYESAPFDYPSTVPAPLATLCNDATAPDPARRPRSAAAFRAVLADYRRHLSSRTLSSAAARSLDALWQILDRERSGPAELIDASGLAAEARFGYAQALEQWKDNEEAKAGLRRCLEAQVRIQLERRDLAGARALLEKMESPPAALEQAVANLADELEAERAEVERLRRLGREHDRTLGSSARLLGAIALTGVSLALAAVAHFQPGGSSTLSHRQALVFAVVVFVASLVAILWQRRRLLVNEFNRRAAVVVVVAFLLLIVGRSVGWVAGMSMQHQLIADSLVFATTSAVAAAALLRWIGVTALAFLAGAVAIALSSAENAPSLFLATVLAASASAVLFWRKS